MIKQNWVNQTIWTGDNLPIMRGMNSASVDLIYLDPPFNSKANYAAPISSEAAGAKFKDTWTLNDIDIAWLDLIEAKHRPLHKVIQAAMTKNDKSYLIYMGVRLIEMHRLLKPTGSIYLHCDPTMSHYLKLVMDAIFGAGNFRNELIWHYTGGGRSKTYFSRKHDIIFAYGKNQPTTKFFVDAIRVPYKKTSGYAKSGIVSKTGKKYMPHPAGTPVDDVWDIPIINPLSNERLGYPTQKPLELLTRIITSSSERGDMILDPFCGCGTTCVAAEMEGRQWVGIEINPTSYDLIRTRLDREIGLSTFKTCINRTDIPQRNYCPQTASSTANNRVLTTNS